MAILDHSFGNRVRELRQEKGWTLRDLAEKVCVGFTRVENERLTFGDYPSDALLHRLQEGRPKVLVQDWFKDAQSRGRVRSAVESVLDRELPESYDRVLFTEKCNNVFDIMLNYATQGLKWAA